MNTIKLEVPACMLLFLLMMACTNTSTRLEGTGERWHMFAEGKPSFEGPLYQVDPEVLPDTLDTDNFYYFYTANNPYLLYEIHQFTWHGQRTFTVESILSIVGEGWFEWGPSAVGEKGSTYFDFISHKEVQGPVPVAGSIDSVFN